MDLRGLTDEQLLARLEALAYAEREATADVVEHLAEVDRRDVVIDRGFPSLFEYCRRKLGYSDGYSYNRIRAARAALDFPEVVEKLRSGSLHLDAVVRLYPYLEKGKQSVLLEKAEGASSKEIAAMVAALQPAQASKPDVIRSLPSGAVPTSPLFEAAASAVKAAEVIPPPRRLRFEFEADEALIAKVDRLKSLLRNKYPFARLEEVFDDAAEALLDKIDPSRKTGSNCVRTQLLPVAKVRHRKVPAAVKRVVWKRDGGRCAYVAPDGRRCESVDALQYDHIHPYALGGASDDPANVRLLCRPHNQRLARRRFGPRPKKS